MDRMCYVWKESILLGVEIRDIHLWSSAIMDPMRATNRLAGVWLMAEVGRSNVSSRLYVLSLRPS